MPMSNWSANAASNDNTLGVFIGEGCDASNLNNAAREIMAQTKAKFDSTDASITAIGTPQPFSAILEALSNAGAAADSIPLYTGPGSATVIPVTAFARSVFDDADAATARATLGAISVSAASFANPGYVALNLLSYGLFLAQFGSGSIGASASQVITFPTPFSSAGYPVITGSAALTVTAVSTSSFTINNATGGTVTYRWQALGQ
jgi:hypothetical protein